MSRYNHFGTHKYEQVLFSDVPIGGKFRNDFFDLATKRRRADIICIRTGELSYREEKSGKESTLCHCNNYFVSSFDKHKI